MTLYPVFTARSAFPGDPAAREPGAQAAGDPGGDGEEEGGGRGGEGQDAQAQGQAGGGGGQEALARRLLGRREGEGRRRGGRKVKMTSVDFEFKPNCL